MTGALMRKRKFVDKTIQRKGHVRPDSEASRQVSPGTGKEWYWDPQRLSNLLPATFHPATLFVVFRHLRFYLLPESKGKFLAFIYHPCALLDMHMWYPTCFSPSSPLNGYSHRPPHLLNLLLNCQKTISGILLFRSRNAPCFLFIAVSFWACCSPKF